MNVKKSLECLARETEVFRENLLHFHFDHHKSHMTWTGPGIGKPATNSLSYVTASNLHFGARCQDQQTDC
jgi:hypothetical protein